MHILLTGFNPFGSNAVNPSQLIVEALCARTYDTFTLTTEVLRTEYQYAETRIRELLLEHQPDALVMLGLAGNRNSISLERVAINIDDASIPDNAGLFLQGQMIDADGPPAYWSTLPLDRMYEALQQRGIPVSYSNHAGAFICNHVFYSARHMIETSRLITRSGFIHVPPIADSDNAVPLDTLVEGIEVCLRVL